MADIGGIIGAILGGVSGLAENLFGTSWEDEANRKEQQLGDAPKFEIPKSQLEYEQLMQSRAKQGLPGYSDMLNQIEAQTSFQAASAGRAAGSQVGALAGQGLARANRKKYLRRLGIAQDTAKSQNELAAIQAGASRAPLEQRQFEYNQWLPWQIAKNEIASIRGAGQQQLMSGLDQTAAAGIYASNMFGNNTGGRQPQAQTSYTPYNYGAAGAQIEQMGRNQMDPYYAQTNNTQPWMTQPF